MEREATMGASAGPLWGKACVCVCVCVCVCGGGVGRTGKAATPGRRGTVNGANAQGCGEGEKGAPQRGDGSETGRLADGAKRGEWGATLGGGGQDATMRMQARRQLRRLSRGGDEAERKPEPMRSKG